MRKHEFHRDSLPQPKPERLAQWSDLPDQKETIIMAVVALIFVALCIIISFITASFFAGIKP